MFLPHVIWDIFHSTTTSSTNNTKIFSLFNFFFFHETCPAHTGNIFDFIVVCVFCHLTLYLLFTNHFMFRLELAPTYFL